MSNKPLLWGQPTENETEGAIPRRTRGRLGADYIPGYSEIVMANDLAKSTQIPEYIKEKYYKVDFGTGPQELPFIFAWVRVTGPTGELSASANQDAFDYKQKGWRAVKCSSKKQSEFKEQFGYGFPPAATITSDGMIRHRDAALFVVDKKTADRLEAQRIEDNAQFLGRNQPGADDNIDPLYDIEDEVYQEFVSSTHNFNE